MKKIIITLTILFTVALNSQKKEISKENNSIDSIQKLDEVILSTTMIFGNKYVAKHRTCLLYTSPSPRDLSTSRMPSSA